jgi:hypothetical protein
MRDHEHGPEIVAQSSRFRSFDPFDPALYDVAHPIWMQLVEVQTQQHAVEFTNRHGPLFLLHPKVVRLEVAGFFDGRDRIEKLYNAVRAGRGQKLVEEVYRTDREVYPDEIAGRMHLDIAKRDGQYELQAVAENLLQAIFVEFANWVASAEGRVGSCDYCGKQFLYGTGTGHRSTRRFCHDACRVAFNRKRQREQGS